MSSSLTSSASNVTKYGAVEIKAGEDGHQAIGILMRSAWEAGIRFKVLELLSTITVNRIPFVRFRSDLDLSRVPLDRGTIVQAGGGYTVRLAGGTTGSYPITAMLTIARNTELRKYRGTGDPFWERQF